MPEYMHEVTLLLTCNHIVIEDLEAAVFMPNIGDNRKCNICHRDVKIAKTSAPAWKTGEYRPIKKSS